MDKLILAVILITIIIIGAVAAMLFVAVDVTTADYQISTENYESGTFIVGKRFTRPDTYELCYREQFENGLGVERWVTVSREEYLAWETENDK